MEIARMSMALSQSQIQQQVSLSLMKKTMEQTEQKGDFVNQMLKGANNLPIQHPSKGSQVDIKV